MNKEAAERALFGKPIKDDEAWEGQGQNAHPSGERFCDYEPIPGTLRTHVTWGKDGKPQVELTFAKEITWQKAAKLIGLDPAKLRFKKEGEGAGHLERHGLRGFDLYFTGYMHKDRSSGLLSNEAGHGLPQLFLDPKR